MEQENVSLYDYDPSVYLFDIHDYKGKVIKAQDWSQIRPTEENVALIPSSGMVKALISQTEISQLAMKFRRKYKEFFSLKGKTCHVFATNSDISETGGMAARLFCISATVNDIQKYSDLLITPKIYSECCARPDGINSLISYDYGRHCTSHDAWQTSVIMGGLPKKHNGIYDMARSLMHILNPPMLPLGLYEYVGEKMMYQKLTIINGTYGKDREVASNVIKLFYDYSSLAKFCFNDMHCLSILADLTRDLCRYCDTKDVDKMRFIVSDIVGYHTKGCHIMMQEGETWTELALRAKKLWGDMSTYREPACPKPAREFKGLFWEDFDHEGCEEPIMEAVYKDGKIQNVQRLVTYY